MRQSTWKWMRLVAVSAALSAMGATPADTAPRYIDPSYGFSMGVPNFGPPSKDRATVLAFMGPVDDSFQSTVNVLIDPGKTTLPVYLEAARRALKRNELNATEKPLKISGRDGVILEYEAKLPNHAVHYLQLVVVGEDRVYVVTCTAAAEKFAALEPEFRRCLESFQLPG